MVCKACVKAHIETQKKYYGDYRKMHRVIKPITTKVKPAHSNETVTKTQIIKEIIKDKLKDKKRKKDKKAKKLSKK
jgi:hypothetical protein